MIARERLNLSSAELLLKTRQAYGIPSTDTGTTFRRSNLMSKNNRLRGMSRRQERELGEQIEEDNLRLIVGVISFFILILLTVRLLST